jgi:hypothetical protein
MSKRKGFGRSVREEVALSMKMVEPPSRLDGADILLFCPLDERVRPTGGHSIQLEDGTMYVPTNAAICQYENSETVYRFYCNDDWEVVTDTVHYSVQEAIDEIESGYAGATALLRKPS